MSKRWFYQEELFFAQENNSLREINQDKIIDMLNRNGAVGVVAGFYEVSNLFYQLFCTE